MSTRKRKRYTTSPPLPDVIKIGARAWKLEIVENPGDQDNWGATIPYDHCIQLADDYPNMGLMLEVLVHEIFHALWITGKPPRENHEHKIYSEEEYVNTLGLGFASVLVDNPALTNWINWAIKTARKENQA